MKKLIVCILILSLLLCGCTEQQSYDPAKLEYPGLHWGVSPEEALDVLGKTRADIIEESVDKNEDVGNANYWDYGIAVHGVEAFGQETTLMLLNFRDYTKTGESYGLTELRFCYPDGYDGTQMADMAALAAELDRLYGAAGEAKYWDRETDTTSDGTPEHPANTFEWGSMTNWSCLSEEEQEACKRIFHDGTERLMTWEEYVEELDAYPAFSILLQPIYSYTIEVRLGHPLSEEQRELGMTDLCITMDARSYYNMKHSAQLWLEAE